jgi:hypothetical protein
MVMFRFKAGTPPERVTEVVAGFGALSHKIPGITHFEWGANASPEGKDKGLTHCFRLDFVDAAARDVYLPHPAHVAFASSLGDVVEDVCVVDYEPDGT